MPKSLVIAPALGRALLLTGRISSVVERILGKAEVGSSILPYGTTEGPSYKATWAFDQSFLLGHGFSRARPFSPDRTPFAGERHAAFFPIPSVFYCATSLLPGMSVSWTRFALGVLKDGED
jgi:hypothetical protein